MRCRLCGGPDAPPTTSAATTPRTANAAECSLGINPIPYIIPFGLVGCGGRNRTFVLPVALQRQCRNRHLSAAVAYLLRTGRPFRNKGLPPALGGGGGICTPDLRDMSPARWLLRHPALNSDWRVTPYVHPERSRIRVGGDVAENDLVGIVGEQVVGVGECSATGREQMQRVV